MIKTYRKKPVTVKALEFTGRNMEECQDFIGTGNIDMTLSYPNIITSEGIMEVRKGDFIIKEPFDKERGFYPVKPDVFHKTYYELPDAD